jgi:hypothetical protein
MQPAQPGSLERSRTRMPLSANDRTMSAGALRALDVDQHEIARSLGQ